VTLRAFGGATMKSSREPVKDTYKRLRSTVAAETFRTPDWKGMSAASWRNRERGDPTPTLPDQVGGQLNPTWVEWLRGFPAGWTDCGPSETRSSRRSSK
jgi:hypothetical protein